MARRRLNKKVALAGSTVFLLLVLVAAVVILRLNRDPAPFVADGDAAWAVQDYETARQDYLTAFGLTRSPEAQEELLFKLADVYRELNQWDKVLGCWERVITSDPENVRARLGQLKYSYVQTDSLSDAGRGMNRLWEEVLSQASKTLDVVRNAGLLDHETATWEPSFGRVKDRAWSRGPARLGPRLCLIKGRAELELAAIGGVTSPDKVLRQAETDLQEVRKLDPNHPQVYYHLARVFLERGKIAASRGSLDEKKAAEQQAADILAQGIQASGGAAEAHIHALTRMLNAAQTGNVAAARDQMKPLESRYEGLMQEFASDPPVFLAAAQFHALYAAYLDSAQALPKLDRAIEAAERAASLHPDNVDPLIFAAGCYYRRFSAHGDEPALLKAIELTEKALELPDARDTPGPTQFARRYNRFSLCSLLAKCCIERILMLPVSDGARTGLLARAEKAVHEIGQIQGGGENPDVLKWQGMLDLVRGNTDEAIRTLYAAYEQIKAANPPEQRDAFLAYMLSKAFKETSETGAVIDFLATALSSGIVQTKPEAILDYADALLEVSSCDAVLIAVNAFEERFGQNGRSRSLRSRALLAKGDLVEAEEGIARLNPNDPNTLVLSLHLVRAESSRLQTAIGQQELAAESLITLQSAGGDRQERSGDGVRAMETELHNLRRRQADLVQRLLQVDPNIVQEGYITGLCDSLVQMGDTTAAKSVVNAFLRHSPDSVAGLFYQRLLAEPDPLNCPASRRKEIREQAILAIADPVRRALELGLLYEQNERYEDAVSQWHAVLDGTASQSTQATPAYLRAGQPDPRRVAAGNLFDLAHHQENWRLAGEIAAVAKRDNLDDCGGYLYAARLASAKKEYGAALSHLEECLRQRPVFSYGYMLRGNVKTALGREQEAVADIRKAAHLNPMDPLIAKALANTLYQRNVRLGNALSSEQSLEATQALERAVQLNPRDTNLLSVYADSIRESEPLKAVAIRQTIQAAVPSLNNAVTLGKLATRVGKEERDPARREMLFKVAETAFEQARQADPTSQFMLDSYAEYFRAREQNDKARQLLVDSNDKQLLWRHYYRAGRYDQARKLLEEMYAQSDGRIDALKGFVLIAEQASDREGVRKYSEELLSLEDSAVNRLAQLRAYLEVGLTKEAEQRLQSFKEKYADDPRIPLMEALLAKSQGQLDRALTLANHNLERNQGNAAAWRLRGEVYFLMGDYDRAILDFRKSGVLEDDPVTAVGLAKAYLWAGRDDDAISELRRVLSRPDTSVLARSLLESIYLRLGRREALKQLYAETVAEFPDNVYWLNRAGAFAIGQSEYDRAEELYAKACAVKQRLAAGLPAAEAMRDAQFVATLDGYLRALILAAGDRAENGGTWRPEKLAKAFEEANKHVDTPYAAVVLYRMAEAQKKLGDVSAARDYCRRAVNKAWINDQLAVEVLLRIRQMLGSEEVREFCRERLATEPDSPAAHFAMFTLAKIENNYDEALESIDRCIRLAGPDTERGTEYTIRKAGLLTTAHKTTSDKRYLERAIGVYESLRMKMPKNSSVLNNLAYMLAQNDQRLAEALEYATAAVEQAPDEVTYLDTYAYVLHKNGKHAQAAQSLAAVLHRYEAGTGAPAEVYEHLGMVNEALGERDKARAAYRRALDVGGDTLPVLARSRIGSAFQRLAP